MMALDSSFFLPLSYSFLAVFLLVCRGLSLGLKCSSFFFLFFVVVLEEIHLGKSQHINSCSFNLRGVVLVVMKVAQVGYPGSPVKEGKAAFYWRLFSAQVDCLPSATSAWF